MILRRAKGCVFVAEFADRQARERSLSPASTWLDQLHAREPGAARRRDLPDNTFEILLAEWRHATENERQQLWSLSTQEARLC